MTRRPFPLPRTAPDVFPGPSRPDPLRIEEPNKSINEKDPNRLPLGESVRIFFARSAKRDLDRNGSLRKKRRHFDNCAAKVRFVIDLRFVGRLISRMLSRRRITREIPVRARREDISPWNRSRTRRKRRHNGGIRKKPGSDDPGRSVKKPCPRRAIGVHERNPL